MSLQIDAQECLREAIAERNNVDVPPDLFGLLRPSDSRIGAQTGRAWLKTLGVAADRLRGRGHDTRDPTLGEATALLNKVLTYSQAYLEQLSRSGAVKLSSVLVWGAVAAATAAFALTATKRTRRRR